ncbi:hypothetical protein NVP1121O_118 [Vibrio phage 1.121.O._10N.286.46.C4]|nr:hypothetical protein NVP1121O_118 [Vibrio phage 1.121.O._10N.286.46.C4]
MNITIDNKVYQIDTDTGEVLRYQVDLEGLAVLEVCAYSHNKINYPTILPAKRQYTLARDLAELESLCMNSSYDKDQNAVVDISPKLFEVLRLDPVKYGVKVGTVLNLTHNIQRRNVWVTTRDQLAECLGVNSKNLNREVDKLKGFLKVECPINSRYQVRTVVFNPWFVWKGDFKVRDYYCQKWKA